MEEEKEEEGDCTTRRELGQRVGCGGIMDYDCLLSNIG